MNDYNIIGSTTVYKSEKVQVDKENILLPNGKTVEWEVMVYPDLLMGVPVKDGTVLMTKEWRQGPHEFLTQFTACRSLGNSEEENLLELKREMKEELGVMGGKFEKLCRFANGVRLTGFETVYLVEDFELGEPQRDENEIQQMLILPIKGLFLELTNKHFVTSATLLAAKIIEERFG